MNVLSLFDGISCGQIALNRLNITINNYFSSEIDKHSIAVTQHNYPKTVQIGDVCGVSFKDGVLYSENGAFDTETIDLLIGGSPCQGFSQAGKELNFKDDRSKLFFEFVRILKEVKPKYFLLENVKMKIEWQNVISDMLDVQPIEINSRLVSAQDRKRLYWTNIPNIQQPMDKNISFADVCEDGGFCGCMRGRRIDHRTNTRADYDKNIPIKQYIECRKDNKSNCLTTVIKDNVVVYEKKPRTHIKETKYRFLTPIEFERLQTIPDNYTSIAPKTKRYEMLGNAWTVDIITHIFNSIEK